MKEFQIIGRHIPNESYPSPTIYRMRLFAKNCEAAKSRFWYFMSRLHKLKKANGQILSVNEIHEPSPHKVKNFGILLRYDSRSGTHNIYKEFRGTSRADVVSTCTRTWPAVRARVPRPSRSCACSASTRRRLAAPR